MSVRAEEPRDVPAVRALHSAAFGDHGRVVADLVDALRAAPGTVSLVAERDRAVVGHVMTSPAWLDAPARLVDVRVLSPLAVLPAAQGRGTGAALVAAALAEAESAGAPAVFLEGDPAYYRRLGFRPGGPLGLRRPSLRIPEAAFQVHLLPAWDRALSGTLVYPDVFWRLDAVGLRDGAAREGGDDVLTLVRYDMVPEQAGRLREVYPRHRAFLEDFAGSGELLLIGSLEEPLRHGAMGVFTSREAADRFTAGDPFVLEGLVRATALQWDAREFGQRPG